MPKQQGLWTAGYHEKLYNLTNDAIRGRFNICVLMSACSKCSDDAGRCCVVRHQSRTADCPPLRLTACPANTEWVIVTNGDNDYASTFLKRLEDVQNADLIAFDFYSRYHRATGATISCSHSLPTVRE